MPQLDIQKRRIAKTKIFYNTDFRFSRAMSDHILEKALDHASYFEKEGRRIARMSKCIARQAMFGGMMLGCSRQRIENI